MTAREERGLFVYGSLLQPGLRRRLLGRTIQTEPARLPGYERCRGRHFYVRPRPGAETYGLLLFGLSTRDLEILDRYESVPELYRRELAQVEPEGGRPLPCWIYLPTSRALGRG
jgi:gamma-glutamylcyclotransferase (GGCT)/AIG2-like uncharacterized protein YtfP